MEKVKVTQEIADAIEDVSKWHEKDRVIDLHANGSEKWSAEWEALNGLKFSELAKALYGAGYEVEPEFKVGDWVTAAHSDLDKRSIGQITSIIENRIYAKWTVFGDEITVSPGHYNLVSSSMIKHATPEEFAKEKQRMFFDRNGREPWELKKGDLLICLSTRCFKEVLLVNDSGWPRFPSTLDFRNLHVIKKSHEVVCFVEDRKDI